MSDKDCLFCKIIAGEIPSEKVYEDDATYAFKDINPKAKVHVLIVPRKHYANVAELAKEDPAQLAHICLLYTSPSPRDPKTSRMPSSA